MTPFAVRSENVNSDMKMKDVLSNGLKYAKNDEILFQNTKSAMGKLLARTTNISEGKPQDVRNEIRQYFLQTYECDLLIYKQLRSNEVLFKRGDPLRHIILFYLGHTAAFYINKLFLGKVIKTRINEKMESIMAIGVDEMSWDDLNNANYDWPAAEAVYEYREKVKDMVLQLIDTLPLTLPVEWDSPFWIIMMGIEHQRIHIETSSVLLRELPIEDLKSGVFGEICKISGPPPKNELVQFQSNKVVLGRQMKGREYGWDMEYGRLECELKPFEASKYLCSNGEFYEFVKAGGYQNKKYWTEEGWTWVQFTKAKHPLFWLPGSKAVDSSSLPTDYHLRLVADVIEMPWNWPVEVNQLEAAAFCVWKSEVESKDIHLISEAEWLHIYEVACIPDELDWKGGAPGNINLEHFSSPCPVDLFRHGNVYDAMGNVWQHTRTILNSFPGFQVHPLYDDFSVPTFDGKHNLIKGGSWISTGNEALKHARYAFRRHFYEHAGFRYVVGGGETCFDGECEAEEDVRKAITDQWGLDNTTYYKKVIDVIKGVAGSPNAKICDLNTDTGRLAFELVNAVPTYKITAIDLTTRMLRNAFQLEQNMKATFHGDGPYEKLEVDLKERHLNDKHIKGIFFTQDNAMNLKTIHKDFDVIVNEWFENVIDQELYLQNAGERLNKDGHLILLTDVKNTSFNSKETQAALLKEFSFVSEDKAFFKTLSKDVDALITVWKLK